MADKSLSIKGASDEELQALLIRLEREVRLQSLIQDLKRRSEPSGSTNNSCEPSYGVVDQAISTEAPIESLYHGEDLYLVHYGVPGMKWGVLTYGKDKEESRANRISNLKKKLDKTNYKYNKRASKTSKFERRSRKLQNTTSKLQRKLNKGRLSPEKQADIQARYEKAIKKLDKTNYKYNKRAANMAKSDRKSRKLQNKIQRLSK